MMVDNNVNGLENDDCRCPPTSPYASFLLDELNFPIYFN